MLEQKMSVAHKMSTFWFKCRIFVFTFNNAMCVILNVEKVSSVSVHTVYKNKTVRRTGNLKSSRVAYWIPKFLGKVAYLLRLCLIKLYSNYLWFTCTIPARFHSCGRRSAARLQPLWCRDARGETRAERASLLSSPRWWLPGAASCYPTRWRNWT